MGILLAALIAAGLPLISVAGAHATNAGLGWAKRYGIGG